MYYLFLILDSLLQSYTTTVRINFSLIVEVVFNDLLYPNTSEFAFWVYRIEKTCAY